MIDNREALLDELKDILAVYAKRVEMEEGKLSDASESFYCGLLNAMMGGNLKNMNREKPNFPAIDLGDDAPVALDGKAVRLAVQITSTGTRQKVRHTLGEFFSNNLHSRFDRLIVLVTGKTETFKEEPKLPVDFDFHSGRDVWSEKKLLDRIRDLSDDRFEAVADYVHKRLTMPESRQRLNLPLQSGMAAKNFVGREEELRELAQRFEKDPIVVLSGLGGMGKTELAVRFGREYEESGRGWAYFLYFSGSFATTLRSNVAGIIPGYSPEGKPEELIVADALAALNRCGKGDLLILDNADEGSITALRRELSALRMRVLVTSRQESDDMMELGTLSEEALFGLFRRYGAELEEADMRALIGAVDGHTMTVELMARLLHKDQRKDTLSRLKKALGERDLSSGEFGKTESTYHASPDQARINEHLKAVFRVSDMGRAEKNVLRFATLIGESGLDSEMFAKAAEPELKPEPVEPVKRRWFDIFRRKTEEKPQPVPKIRDILQELADKGWLLRKKGDIKIHPVIRIVCVEELKPTEEKCGNFLHGIRNQYDRKQYDHIKFRQMAEVFETASNLLEDKTGFWASWAGYLWNQVAETQRELKCNLRAVQMREQHLPDSNNLAASYNNVGSTYGALGDHKQALEYKLKALAIFERVLPPEHPDLARSYNNVGMTYGALGDHEKDLEYDLKALEIQERVLPPEHPDLATSYNNVGVSYGALGDNQKKLEYYLKALGIRERVLPGNHPSLALSFNNIAWTYYALGRIGEAATHMRRAADIINCSALPETHPNRVNFNKWAEEMEEEARQEETV